MTSNGIPIRPVAFSSWRLVSFRTRLLNPLFHCRIILSAAHYTRYAEIGPPETLVPYMLEIVSIGRITGERGKGRVVYRMRIIAREELGRAIVFRYLQAIVSLLYD